MFNDKCFLTDLTLESIKWKTRRPIKVKNIRIQPSYPLFNSSDCHYKDLDGMLCQLIDGDTGKIIRPRYKVGEIVAIAQSYDKAGTDPGLILNDGLNGFIFNEKGWKNKMFVRPELMPHQIKITGIRAERLQDISEEDCMAEGIQFDGKAQSFYCGFNISTNSKIWLGRNLREAYAALIDRTSGKGTWNSNPFVWVYEYKLVK